MPETTLIVQGESRPGTDRRELGARMAPLLEITLIVQGESRPGTDRRELGARMAPLLEITLVVQARYSWDRRNTTQEGYNKVIGVLV